MSVVADVDEKRNGAGVKGRGMGGFWATFGGAYLLYTAYMAIFSPFLYIYTTSLITGLQGYFCAIKGHTTYSVSCRYAPQYIGVCGITFHIWATEYGLRKCAIALHFIFGLG